MKMTVAVLVGVLVVAVLAILLLRDPPPRSEPDVGGPEAVDPTATDAHLQGRSLPAADSSPPPAASPEDTVAWILSGRVLDPDDGPIANAEVTAWLDPGGARVLLGQVTSGENGAYRLSVEALADTTPAVRLTSAITAIAACDGYRRGEEAALRPLPLEVSSGLNLSLDLRLAPGGSVTGVATDGTGAPLAEVSVYLRTASDEVLDMVDTDAAGTFHLGFSAAPVVEVWAVSRIHGVARSPTLTPDPTSTTDVGELRLVPGGTVEGRVLYADRTPVEGIWVYANLVENTDEDPYASVSTRVVWTQIGAETDSRGRFVMQAFRPGRYTVHVSHAFGHQLDVTAQSGDRDVEIVLPLHKLIVRITDETGRPLPGCQQWTRGWILEAREDFEKVVRGDGDADAGLAGGQFSMAGSIADADGRAVLLVQPGSAWIFLIDLEGLPPLEQVIRVPTEGHETRVDLVVGARGPTGALTIAVLDPYGERIDVFDFELRTNLGSTLARGGSSDPGSFKDVPAGAAKLRVLPGPARHHLDRHCQILSPYFPVDADVEIPAGGTGRVTVDAREGGWIRLHPVLEGDPPEDALGGLRVDVRLVGSEGPWSYARMFLYGEGENLHGTSELLPNEPTRIGQLFEAGASELRILGHGFQGATVPVTVVAGRETPVTVNIERR